MTASSFTAAPASPSVPGRALPMGKVIGGRSDTLELRLVTEKEKEYMREIMVANSELRLDYLALRDKAESIIRAWF